MPYIAVDSRPRLFYCYAATAVVALTLGAVLPLTIGTWSVSALIGLGNGFAICAICAWTAIRRARWFGPSDLGAIVISLFGFYNGLLPIHAGIAFGLGLDIFLPYPESFEVEAFARASTASLLASLGLSIALIRRGPTRPTRIIVPSSLSLMGLAGFALGMAMNVANLARAGGIVDALGVAKIDRLAILSEDTGGLPGPPVTLAGLALLWLVYSKDRLRRDAVLAWAALLTWCGWSFLLGSRKSVLFAGLVALSLWGAVNPERARSRQRAILIAAGAGFVGFAAFAQIRAAIPEYVSGRWTFAEARAFAVENIGLRIVVPSEVPEITAPYYSLLRTVQSDRPMDLSLGRTYLDATINVLPRSLYPGEKPPNVSREFADEIYDNFPLSSRKGTGWGFSPVAEALRNFSWLGPPIVFAILGLALNALRRLQTTALGMVVAALALTQFANLLRTSLNLQGFAFAIGAGVLLFAPARIVEHRSSARTRSRRQVTTSRRRPPVTPLPRNP